jgi:exonuclease SbcC
MPALVDESDELAALQQELSALTDRVTTVPQEEQLRVAQLEARARVAAQALDAWRLGGGSLLEDLLERGLSRFPALERGGKLDVSGLADAALSTLTGEAIRLERLLGDADEVTNDIAELQDDLEKCRERSARLTDTLGEGPTDLVELSEFVANVIPLLRDNVCPVCDRDYAEISDASLRDHLIERAAAISSEARRMQGVADALQESRKLEKELAQRLAELEIRLLSDAERMQITEQLSSITSDRDELDRLAPLARSAEKLNADERTARHALLNERNSISRSAEIRYAAQSVAERLNVQSVSDSESLDSALLRLSAGVEERLAAERDALEHRARIEERRRELSQALDVAAESSARLVAATTAADACRAGFAEFAQRREALRRLASMAEQEFAPAVREVFSSSLNAVWRDLFVRLVPSEPFIPAFRIRPSAGSRITTELQTVYRGGGTAGNPSYMLSAGNLNTAAITLFLALHLSINPKLPWIVLDDPVQSMDEVHISQFAALLRTLSKQQDKRVILAVHERSLFEYLALELSPAYPGDKLVTVELSRDDDGVTEVKPNASTWMGDSALEAS